MRGGTGAASLASLMALGRYPGPVWTMMVWVVISGLNLAVAVALPANNKAATPATVSVLILAGVSACLLMVLAHRTPTWLLVMIVALGVSGTGWLIYDALTPLGVILFALAYLIYSTYSALWAPRWLTSLAVAVMAASFLAILEIRGLLPLMLVGWLLLMSICAGLSMLLAYLVRSLGELAAVDPLTGLMNRTGFEALRRLRPRAGRSTVPRTIVVIDIDGFKDVNDTLGHSAGDDVLRRFGAAVRNALRPDDVAVRLGGDEFVLILPATPTTAAQRVVERLRESTDVGWSAGATDWAVDEDFDEALARADERMYEEKALARRDRGAP